VAVMIVLFSTVRRYA